MNTDGIRLISMNTLTLSFSLYNTTHWSKWVFSVFFSQSQEVILFLLLWKPWLCCAFLFRSQDYLNWLTTDILQLFSVMQIRTPGVGKGQHFQSLHTCLLQFWSWTAEPQFATWPFRRWHFIFRREYRGALRRSSGQLSPAFIWVAKCVRELEKWPVFFFLLQHICLYHIYMFVCIYIYISLDFVCSVSFTSQIFGSTDYRHS